MASLYDLELQESNNFIYALIEEGVTPALKLMLDQKTQAAAMGEMGKVLVEQFEDENSETAQNLKRLEAMQCAIKAAMAKVAMDAALAKHANDIFSKSPESMEVLSKEDQDVIKEYWLKKKTIIVILLGQGYSHVELFA